MNKTQLVEMDIEDLIPADWNYKSDGTPEQIEKLCNSIKEDDSAGVVAVRELDGKFEVIDGNHRLQALKQLKWKKIPCENFGSISKGKAVTIARRRNHKWFEDDLLAYAELFKEEVLQEYDIDQLETFMPETKDEMLNLENILEFDWDQYNLDEKGSEPKDPKMIECPHCGESFEG
tara:strand:+ start:3844 stop:4371 length:528 start_codon:yes stop_codon:yes gene_type:complete